MKEKMNKLKSKEQEKQERMRRLELQKEKFEIQRDPSRLYRPTSATKNRMNTPRSGSIGPVKRLLYRDIYSTFSNWPRSDDSGPVNKLL